MTTDAGLYVLGSQYAPQSGGEYRLPEIMTVRGPALPRAPLGPRAYDINGLVDAKGNARLFWMSPCCVDIGSDNSFLDREALYTSTFLDGYWTQPDRISVARRIGRDGLSQPIMDSDGRVHMAMSVASNGILRPMHILLHDGGWQKQAIASRGVYTRLGMIEGGGVGAVHVSGPPVRYSMHRAGVWLSRIGPHDSIRPALVHASTVNAFDPLLVSSAGSLHVAWTADLDGNPLSWEALYTTRSTHGGTRWHAAHRVDSAGHISRLHALRHPEGLLLVYLRSEEFGKAARIFAARFEGTWSRPLAVLPRSDVTELGVAITKAGELAMAFTTAPSEQDPDGTTYYLTLTCTVAGGRSS